MPHRIQPRRDNGQYQRATLANTFGLGCHTCLTCGGLNPWKVGIEPEPTKCGRCGAGFDGRVPSDEERAAEPGRFWKSTETIPAPTGERVECYAAGWSSVMHGVFDGAAWCVWNGSEVMSLIPELWRHVSQEPRDIIKNRRAAGLRPTCKYCGGPVDKPGEVHAGGCGNIG